MILLQILQSFVQADALQNALINKKNSSCRIISAGTVDAEAIASKLFCNVSVLDIIHNQYLSHSSLFSISQYVYFHRVY